MIWIPPHGVILISKLFVWGNSDHSSKIIVVLLPEPSVHLTISWNWIKNTSFDSPECLLWDLEKFRRSNEVQQHSYGCTESPVIFLLFSYIDAGNSDHSSHFVWDNSDQSSQFCWDELSKSLPSHANYFE
jgi:hypothetical protein